MNNSIKIISYLALSFTMIFISSCSDDGGGGDTVATLNVVDFNTIVDENQDENAVLGSIVATGTDGPFSYSITSQSPTGSIAINATTGEITVANTSSFDFETNPTITATINVEGNSLTETLTVTITLNDTDELDVSDFTATVDENQAVGVVLGTVVATGTGGDFVYSITNQSPAGSIAIDAATGEITVADASSFDFETNPTITATVSVTGNSQTETATITITLNDLDGLGSILSDSRADYIAAADGDWIQITEGEYTSLANNLNEVTKVGTTDAEYASVIGVIATGSHSRTNYTTNAIIPKNGYTIAFKYKISNGTNVTGFKVKQSSTSNTDGYSDLGNALPSHSGSSQDVFFILKGNNTPVTADGYLGIYQPDSVGLRLLSTSTTGNGAYWANGDVSSIDGGQWYSWLIPYQGLSTTQKQW